ncbi:hypothetical protein D9M72_295360 [compost metagenome]
MGAQQGGVEAPAQGFDVGVPPGAFLAAHALAAEAQVLAGVGGEAAVVDPEFAHGQVALVRLAAVVALARVGFDIAGFQGVGLDGVGGGDRLAHGEGAPLAALAVDPGAQVETDTVDVAAIAGAEVAVVFRLRGDLHVQAEVPAFGFGSVGDARGQQGQAQACLDPGILVHVRFISLVPRSCSAVGLRCALRQPAGELRRGIHRLLIWVSGVATPRTARSSRSSCSARARSVGGSCCATCCASSWACGVFLGRASWLKT